MFAEALVGLLIGLAVQFVFEAAQFAGQVMGMQVGFGLVNILDPSTQVDTPVLAVFSQTIAMLIFLQLGVHRWLMQGTGVELCLSPAQEPPAASGELTRQLLHAAGGIWLAGVQIAAPAADRYSADRLGAGFPGQSFAAIAGAVSRPLGEEHGRPGGAGLVAEVLAGNLRTLFHHARFTPANDCCSWRTENSMADGRQNRTGNTAAAATKRVKRGKSRAAASWPEP